MDEGDVRRIRSGRLKMLGIMLLCAAPVVASYFTYYVIRPEGGASFGQLIDPQKPAPALEVSDGDGKKIDLRSLKGQWSLVTVAGAACDARCEKQLYLQRQLRETLGREKDRVDRVWLVDDQAALPDRLKPALDGARVLRVPGEALSAWLAPAAGHALEDHLYLVDPMGNWMLRWPAGMDMKQASKAKRDLDRVLRASASWDEPGR